MAVRHTADTLSWDSKAPQLLVIVNSSRNRRNGLSTIQLAQLQQTTKCPSQESEFVRPTTVHPQVTKLERTYLGQNLESTVISMGDSSVRQQSAPIHSVTLPMNGLDLLERIRSYVLAKLHPKGTSIRHIVQQVQGTIGDDEAGKHAKTYRMLWAGRQWEALCNLFDLIVKERSMGGPGFRPHGIICLLGNEYLWFKAKQEHRRTALTNLCVKTNLYKQTEKWRTFIHNIVTDTRSMYPHLIAFLS
ncbi:hypothetical protein F4678DRAFT_334979 [Xylaria arbuscula]|nr:hypothetical protein F4678DRAFT_334979 [Xylaria arbuscula]